jgi:lipopolysaccharide export LptBFGC system permease protein LptF
MIFTLQKYIFKELFRAFFMTAIALTCMLGFGGGLMDMMRSQGITAKEMLKLLFYLMPVVLSYSLPIAALFSTTITYGRLSADNEIVACRASGINVFRLLTPAIILSILVFLFTFTLNNFLIPNLTSQIESLVKSNIQKFAYLRLKNQGYISQMDYALHCGKIDEVQYPEMQADGTASSGLIELSKVAFLRQGKNSVPEFYGTAEKALIVFDMYNQKPTVSVHLNQVRAFDEGQGQMIQAAYYPIPPIEIPPMTAKKIKFMSLPALLEIEKDPMAHEELRKMTDGLRISLLNSLAYAELDKQIKQYGECRFQDNKGGRCTITAKSYRPLVQKDGRIVFEGDVVVEYTLASGLVRQYEGRQAYITAYTASQDSVPMMTIEMKETARITEKVKGKPDRVDERKEPSIGPFAAPGDVLAKAKAITLEQLLSDDPTLDLNHQLSKFRGEVMREERDISGKCKAEIHSRASYSSSSLVLLLLGAGLGIIFRGGHFVSAFGLSFIPVLVVVVMIMTGKQLGSAGIETLGVFVIWLGVILVAVADIVVLGKFLRR